MEIELETRRKIYELLLKSPGIHFREMERRLDIAVGSLQYHLHYMEKRNLIRVEQDGEYIRYYPKEIQLSSIDKEVLSFLRKRTSRRILIYLLNHPEANNKELSERIGLSPSTVSWHLNRLVETEIIKKRKEGRESYFKIKEPGRIAKLFVTYKESFLDKLVDGFVEMWEHKEK